MKLVNVDKGVIYVRSGEASSATFSVGDARTLLAELPVAIEEARSFLIDQAERKRKEAEAELDALRGIRRITTVPPAAARADPEEKRYTCPECGGKTDGNGQHPNPGGGTCTQAAAPATWSSAAAAGGSWGCTMARRNR